MNSRGFVYGTGRFSVVICFIILVLNIITIIRK
jgi:hypothetical protein